MASPLLDVKKFKHVKSDEHTTTLQHADGHQLTLNHKALSKPNQEQLKALAKLGGPKEDSKDLEEAHLKEGRDADVDRVDRPDQGHGKVIYKAEGGTVPDVDKEVPGDPSPMAPQSAKKDGGGLGSLIPLIAMLAAEGGTVPDSTEESKVPDYLKPNNTAPEYLKPNSAVQQPPPQGMPAININVGGGTPAQAQPVQPPAPKQPSLFEQGAAAYAPKQGAQPPAQEEEQPQPNSIFNPAPDSIMGKQSGIAPAQQSPDEVLNAYANSSSKPVVAPMDPSSPDAGTAQGTVNKPSVVKPAANVPSVEKPELTADQKVIHEDQSWQNDLNNGHIQPKTYRSMFASKDTLGKIGTIFGMLLSGAGSGLSKQPNMLMEMMNNEIAKDLEAQKASKSNALNFHNLAEQHSLNQANISHLQVTDKITNDQLAQQLAGRAAFHDLMLKTNAMPDGPMKQSALQTLGMISQGLDSKAINIADQLKAKQALYSSQMGANGPDNILMKINQAKNIYGEHTAAEALKELPEYEKKQKVMSGVHEAMEEMYKNAAYKDIPLSQKGQQYEAAKTKVKTLTSELFGGKSEAEFKLIEGLLPGRMTNKQTYDKQKSSIMQKLDSQSAFPVLERIGAVRPTQVQAPQNEPVKGADGRMYVKSADGKFMIPVKK